MSDRYQTITVAHRSRAGTIYRGWDKHQNRDVSFQRIHASGEAAVEVLREARAWYGLRHPQLATVLEYGEDAEGVYVVREMVKGKPLSAIISQRALTMDEFRSLVRLTLGAMHEAHMSGLIHRNLQPNTIIVPWNAQNTFGVKITDFTLGAPADLSLPADLESERFMAPEQFGNSPVTLHADLYSLGNIFYYALTQRHAFEGEDTSKIVVAHLYHQHVPLDQLRPDLPQALCAWVERLMSFHAVERPASAEEALGMFAMLPDEDDGMAVVAAEVEEPEVLAVLEESETEVPQDLAAEGSENAAQAEPLTEAPAEGAEVGAPDRGEPEPTLEPAEEEQLRESEAAAATAESAPEPIRAEVTQTLVAVAVEEEPDAVARRPVAGKVEQPESRHATPTLHLPERRSGMNLIVVAFVVIALGMLGLVSVLKYQARNEHATRLGELAASEHPQGSDVDVQMLLGYLEERDHRDEAASILVRLQGGDYINAMLVDRVGQTASHSTNIKLVEVLGDRGVEAALPKILPLTHDQSKDMRKAAWTALAKIANSKSISALVGAADGSRESEEELIRDSLIAAIEHCADRERANEAALKGYQNAKDPETREILLKVMTRVGGGPETLRLVTQAISDASDDVRRAAIVALAQYPSHDPLAAITERFPNEQDSSCRAYLLAAAEELAGKPGESSQEELAKQVQGLYVNARTQSEKDRALRAVSQVIAPSTVTFYENFANQGDPRLSQQALRNAAAFKDRLKEIIEVAPGSDATPVPAALANYTVGGAITLEGETLSHWTQAGDWASWLIQFPQNGRYEIRVYQAHAAKETGTYEVDVAGKKKVTTAVSTGSDTDFKGFIVGEFAINSPGTYRVVVQAKRIPEGGELFRLQKLAVKFVAEGSH